MALTFLPLLTHATEPASKAPLDRADHQTRRPNIVLIIGDDHGWRDSGFMGSTIAQTPNLDALAAEGTLFTNAHSTASICQPALKALLAGVHHTRWVAKRDALAARGDKFRPRQEVVYFRTLPSELRKAGYLSWEGGKHWEGTFAQAGFSHGLAVRHTHLFTNAGAKFGRDGWLEGTALAPFQHFLDETGDSPFFAWIAPLLPHFPFDSPEEFRLAYAALGLTTSELNYYANVTWFDAFLGTVVAELDARGVRDNTLIIYLADNGWEVGDETNVFRSTGHGKSSLYDSGTRTPLILNWPGIVPSGVVRDDLVSILDIFPTILDYAGADQVPDRWGRSLRASVEDGAAVGHDTIVTFHPGETPSTGGYTVRTQDWHYLRYSSGREELYAIREDPFERDDRAHSHPALLDRFRAEVVAWQRKIDENPMDLPAEPLR